MARLHYRKISCLLLFTTFRFVESRGYQENCWTGRSQQGACETFVDDRDGRQKEYACSSITGVCELPALVWEACTPYAGARDCDLGLDCMDDAVCRQAKGLGEECLVSTSDLVETCGSIGRCVDSRCIPLLAEGEGDCGEDNNFSYMNCEGHLTCDTRLSRTCVARKDVGEPCFTTADCKPYSTCRSSVCMALSTAGGICGNSHDCAGNLACVWDPQGNVCELRSGTAPVGPDLIPPSATRTESPTGPGLMLPAAAPTESPVLEVSQATDDDKSVAPLTLGDILAIVSAAIGVIGIVIAWYLGLPGYILAKLQLHDLQQQQQQQQQGGGGNNP